MAETDFDFGQATAATFLGMALTPWPANVSRGFNCFLLTMAAAALLVGWFATHVPPPTAEHPQIYIGLNPQMASVFFIFSGGQRTIRLIRATRCAPDNAGLARVGEAMGASGSSAALEQAEVILMNNRLENFLTALKFSCRARAIIRPYLVISLGTVAVLVVCAMRGKIPLTLGVIGHEGSTVIVVLNSLRLLLRVDRT